VVEEIGRETFPRGLRSRPVRSGEIGNPNPNAGQVKTSGPRLNQRRRIDFAVRLAAAQQTRPAFAAAASRHSFCIYDGWVMMVDRRTDKTTRMTRWTSTMATRLREPLEDVPERLARGGNMIRSAARDLAHRPRPRAIPIGAIALGALAIGALAIGFIAIGGLSVGRARIGRLQVDNLIVRRRRRLPDPEPEEEIWR
jgi:hypothetical protein